MKTKSEIIKSVKKMVVIFSIVVGLGVMLFIPPSSAQIFPYYPPAFFTPIYYPGYVPIVGTGLIDPLSYFYPSRTSAIVTSTLLSTLYTAPTVPATTTLLGLSTAITLASTGGGINTTTLALLASTPVPTAPTITPTIGTTTLLLLGGVNTTTLLLLGI